MKFLRGTDLKYAGNAITLTIEWAFDGKYGRRQTDAFWFFESQRTDCDAILARLPDHADGVADDFDPTKEQPALTTDEIVGGMARMASHTWNMMSSRAPGEMICSQCQLTESEAAASIFRCGGTVAKPDPASGPKETP